MVLSCDRAPSRLMMNATSGIESADPTRELLTQMPVANPYSQPRNHSAVTFAFTGSFGSKILSGFITPLGSTAIFMRLISSISIGSVTRASLARLERPMPCSALIAPRSARLVIDDQVDARHQLLPDLLVGHARRIQDREHVDVPVADMAVHEDARVRHRFLIRRSTLVMNAACPSSGTALSWLTT
jgi:hypothetical protein